MEENEGSDAIPSIYIYVSVELFMYSKVYNERKRKERI